MGTLHLPSQDHPPAFLPIQTYLLDDESMRKANLKLGTLTTENMPLNLDWRHQHELGPQANLPLPSSYPNAE